MDSFGDVDDFGGGNYKCTWESDIEDIEVQRMKFAGEDWISFKTRITYQPTVEDVGSRTITLTVRDPDGNRAVKTFVVQVENPGPLSIPLSFVRRHVPDLE